jgi:hypothetical protein
MRNCENPDANVAPPSPLAGEKAELKKSPKLVDHRAKVRKDHPSHSVPPTTREYCQDKTPIDKRPIG